MKYFTFQFPSEGVTLQIEVLEGSIVLYATDIIQTPNEALYTWKIATSKCKDLFLDPVLCQTMGDSVNLAIIGLEQVNTFILKTIPGIKGKSITITFLVCAIILSTVQVEICSA